MHTSYLLTPCLHGLFATVTSAVAAQHPGAIPPKPIRLAIAGLVHGHVGGFLALCAQDRKDVEIVGIYEPNAELARLYARRYKYPESLLFTDLHKMLDAIRPEGIATFTNTFDHTAVVEACATRHIPVMMEKPLAVSMEHARRMQNASNQYGIPVVVNYETTWYPSHAAIWDLVKQQHALGDIRKIVAMDGHEGPKEIGVGPEFLSFLTDPKLNGGGALFDFGCYGANLATWLMDNRRPISVMALTQQIKPRTYPYVDDEATVLVEYPHAQCIIEGSWNWPTGRKDLEVYGERGYVIATGGKSLRTRVQRGAEETSQPTATPSESTDPLTYFLAVVRGKIKPTGLSSLENNMIVTEILVAARESARTGTRIVLSRAP